MKKVIIFLAFIFSCFAGFSQAQGGVGNNYVGRFYNVADAPYNATTASSNNAVAIQKAINAANANGGGMVYLPRMNNGVWKSGKLSMYSNVTLKGDGFGDTLQSATADTLITYVNGSFTGAQGAVIEGLTLFGNSSGTVAISAQLLFHFNFKDLYIFNFTQYGIYGKGILIGKFDNLVVGNCNIGVYLDSMNFAGVVAPNVITFTGGELRDNVTWGIQVKNSQGIGCNFNGTTFENNGTLHSHATGAVSWTLGTTVGLTFVGCWWEANKGILVFMGASTGTVSHTFMNCFMFQNSSASVGLDLNCPSAKLWINLIGTNLQSDSLDIFLDNVSVSAFFTNLAITLMGNTSFGTINTATPWLYMIDVSKSYLVGRLTINSGVPTVTLKNGAGAGATFAISTTATSGSGTITVTTAGVPAANDTIAIIQMSATGFVTGSDPVLSEANAAAATLTTAKPFYNGTTNKIYILSNAVGLTTGTVYKWSYIWGGL